MKKADVIKLRTTLKQGKNLPLLVLIDNTFMNIDESDTARFTIWDDDNEFLYQFMLPVPHMQRSYTSKDVALYAVHYEHIQGMQCNCMPVRLIDDCIEAIKSSGHNISDDFKNLIINTYDKLTDNNTFIDGPMTFNNLISSTRRDPEARNAVDESNDYYKGYFRENARITKPTRDYNKSVEDEINASKESRTNENLILDENINVEEDTNIVTGREYTSLNN